MPSKFLSADDGADSFVIDTGAATRGTVMLVHGFSLDHTTWDPIASLLVDAGFRVVRSDLRGHGRSTLGSDEPTVERLCADLAATITALDLTSVHLVGHSLGAVVALAARTNDQLAGSIRTVTSVAGTERSIQNPVMRLGAQLFSSQVGRSLLGRAWPGRLMISTWFGKKPTTEHLDWIRKLSAACAGPTRVAVSAATGELDLRPTFSLPGPPTLVLAGRKDRATSCKVSERIASAIVDSRFVLIEGAGHMVIIEQPRAVVDAIIELVGQP